MTEQNYEEYWKLTLEYSDIHSDKFIGTLRGIVDFVDTEIAGEFTPAKYDELQKKIFALFPKEDMASVRKSINQFIKLGFVDYNLLSYHPNIKDFLEARTNKRRETLFSKIVYTNSSFNRSVTNQSNQKELNFLLNTLEENGKLHKKDVVALMTLSNLEEIPKGYLTEEELVQARKNAEQSGFVDRKYNQVSYLWGILDKLDDLVIIDDFLCFEEDAQVYFPVSKEKNVREGYLHRIYKNQLKEECQESLGAIKCMVEQLAYPTLIASHIKPFIKSNKEEAYDPDNGLLLSPNIDSLFDKGHVSFNDDGTIILSKQLDSDLQQSLSSYSLDQVLLRDKRKAFLQVHRDLNKAKLI